MCRHKCKIASRRCRDCHKEDDKCDCGLTRERCLNDPHSEERSERRRKYRLEHREEIKERMGRWRKKSVEKEKQYKDQYLIDHGEAMRKYNRMYDLHKPFKRKIINMWGYDKRWFVLTSKPPDYLTEEQLEAKWNASHLCHWCGIEMTLPIGGKQQPTQMTPDRLDNTYWHTDPKCVLACWKCNTKRGIEWKNHGIQRPKEKIILKLKPISPPL